MKIVGVTALHYGTDYLAYAIRSVIDHIDEYHVLYAAQGSHGHRTDLVCPDTREQLYAIAQQAAGDKLHWHDGEWEHEGQQRDSIYQYAPDADVIIVLDADEIWPEDVVKYVIEAYEKQWGWIGIVRNLRVPMIHYWRSMWKAILHDPAYPIRVIYPQIESGESTLSTPCRIAHMGYAQRPEIVEYKQHTHGHKGEWRKDCDWFNDVFMDTNRTTDLHPVGSEYWNYELVYPLDYLPSWMVEHPYFTLPIIY